MGRGLPDTYAYLNHLANIPLSHLCHCVSSASLSSTSGGYGQTLWFVLSFSLSEAHCSYSDVV